mgnify:FL=1
MASYQTNKQHFINILANYLWKVIDLLAYNFPIFAKNYYDRSIGSQYRREYYTYDIKKTDKVIHIGCGIFPLTEITLAQTTNATIHGIDKDKKIINKALQAVNYYGLNEKIQITHGNGTSFPLKDYSVIIISSCASPKIPILTHIINEMKSGSKIIIREVESSSNLIFSELEKNNKIKFVDSITHQPFPFFSQFG